MLENPDDDGKLLVGGAGVDGLVDALGDIQIAKDADNLSVYTSLRTVARLARFMMSRERVALKSMV